MARIFISYRRSDTKWVAARLYDRLSEVLGRENVFFDVSDIEPGEDFVAKIGQIVARCDILLAVIGPSWLSVCNSSGKRRLELPTDLIRVEIGAALKRNIRVIPVLVDGAEMPEENQLPEDLAPLAHRNARDVSFARFHTDLDSFIRVLQRILSGSGAAGASTPLEVAPPVEARPKEVVAEILPYTISVETLGGVATPLIAKEARLPAEYKETFSTAADNQTSVEVSLFLGERHAAKENAPIGKFVLAGIPPAAKGAPQIQIKVSVDRTLILTVTAEDEATHKKQVLDAVDLTQITLTDAQRREDANMPAPPESTRDSRLNFFKFDVGSRSPKAKSETKRSVLNNCA